VPAGAQPGVHWVTLDEGHAHPAAQAQFSVRTDWPQEGFGAQGRRFNAYENTINSGNVSGLNRVWSMPAGGYGNPSPFIQYGSYLYVSDVTGTVHAYRASGSLLWTASPGTDLPTFAPAASSSRVYIGGANGNVYAYAYTCRTDGGTCTPLWTHNVGTGVTGPLTVKGGLVYAPSSDGTVHTLNSSTGAPGTPLAPLGGSGAATGVAVAPDGSWGFGRGSYFEDGHLFGGSSGSFGEGGTVSSPAESNRSFYFTTSDGNLHAQGAALWTAPIPGAAGCNPAPPAVANSVVYAGSCDYLAAFDAGTGALQWSVSTGGSVLGLVVAGDVLYACAGSSALRAYAASYGGLLWSGGYCSSQPVVVNGVLYSADAYLDAYDLTSARGSGRARRTRHRPNPARLRPDPRLHRHHRHHGR
jgi:glucose dehydrogenase